MILEKYLFLLSDFETWHWTQTNMLLQLIIHYENTTVSTKTTYKQMFHNKLPKHLQASLGNLLWTF